MIQISILLEGILAKDQQNELIWEGNWQFAKEKKTDLKFRHKKLGNSIPKNIFDFLCFKSDFLSNDDMMSDLNKLRSINDENNKDLSNNHSDVKSISIVEDKCFLFGLWEGSFQIARETNDKVMECFFIHSFIGQEILEEFADLPCEPNITLSVLKVNDNIVQSFIAKPLFIPEFSAVPHSNVDQVYNKEDDVSNKNNVLNLSTNDSESNILTNNITGSTKVDNNAVESLKLPIISSKVIKDYGYILVYGFGCNAIGRFSIVGAFQISTGSFRCEKKYIVSKGVRKFRKYSADSIQQRENKRQELTLGNPKTMTTRPKLSGGLYFDNYFDINTYNSHIDTHSPKKKKKIVTSNYYGPSNQYDDRQSQGKTLEYIIDEDLHYRSAFLDEENGEVYEGGWYNGFKHGSGVCLFSDGNLYEGSWVFGKMSGKGTLMTGEREVIYSGEWSEGLMHGQGVYNFSNVEKYIGDWKEGMRHGKGEYLCQNGCKYIGDWKENKRSGRGIFKWPDGSVYDGEWELDKRHGKGILELKSGFSYDGQWANNYFEGKGVNIFPSGQEYRGTFRQGLREGRGSIKFSEGAEYEGRFKDDKLDGHGTLKVIDVVPGAMEGERLIPIQVQSDIKRIHFKAGFGDFNH